MIHLQLDFNRFFADFDDNNLVSADYFNIGCAANALAITDIAAVETEDFNVRAVFHTRYMKRIAPLLNQDGSRCLCR